MPNLKMQAQAKARAIKAVAMGRVYDLSITRDYVSGWGVVEAVRELIQNALDSDSPFVYEWVQDVDGNWSLYLNSEHTVLERKTLLLGATSKSQNSDAIGSFGEGYKIAMLVLLRESYELLIHNGEVLWTPEFHMSKVFETEVLAVREQYVGKGTHRFQGLTFSVGRITDQIKDEISLSCLCMQDNVGAIKRTQFGDILLDQPGKLYVGSLLVCETKMKFGYNVLPRHMRLERDRQTVNEWDLKSIALKMWYDTKEIDRVVQMIADQIPDVEYAEYNSPQVIADACYAHFRKNYPQEILALSPEDLKEKVAQGMTKTVYVGGGAYSSMVRSHRNYQEEIQRPAPEVLAPHIVLERFKTDYEPDLTTSMVEELDKIIRLAKLTWSIK